MVQAVVTAEATIHSHLIFEVDEAAVGPAFLCVLRLYPHSLHVPVSLTRKIKGAKLVNLPKAMFFRQSGSIRQKIFPLLFFPSA